MAKIAQTSVKYLIKAKFKADGMVEKPDVIGALFGQTEGLLGSDLDLRELQRTGRIGRIEVIINVIQGKAHGSVSIPASLDGAETSLIAAALETIDRVGPCNAKIMVDGVEDLRTTKRKYIVDRAKSLLSSLLTQVPETTTITEDLMKTIRSAEITEYQGLAAGPDVATAEEIIVCEGRADVMVLLKHGVKNAIAVGGTSMPPQMAKISKEHQLTVFLDGDRGGDLIFKELKAIADIDFVARAPEGKEVEELTKKEIFTALRDKVPADQAKELKPIQTQNNRKPQNSRFTKDARDTRPRQKTFDQKPRQERFTKQDRSFTPREEFVPPQKSTMDDDLKEFCKKQLNDLMGTRAAAIFDENRVFAGRVPVKELSKAIKQVQNPSIVVVDADADRDIISASESANVSYILTTKKAQTTSRRVKIITNEDLK
ncbi:DNA primase [archaeon]|nr:DNA primase [archaeon]